MLADSTTHLQESRAIVVDEPGVTRDRLYGRSFWGDNEFMVVDTGGVLNISKSQDDLMDELAISTTIGMEGIPLASREAAVARMPSMIERQATVAVEESSVIIFLVDGQVCSSKGVYMFDSQSCQQIDNFSFGRKIAISHYEQPEVYCCNPSG